MNIATILKRLGHSTLEAKIYCAVSTLGTASITDISHATGLHRPSVYRGVAALIRGNLMSAHAQGKRLQYRAVAEKVIIKMWQNTKNDYRPQEKQERSPLHKSLKVSIGQEAVRDAFDHVVDTLRRGDTFYRITSEKSLDEVNALLSADYRRKRDAKRLERLVISNSSSRSKKQKRLERFIRYIDTENTNFNQNIIELIYADFVSFIDLTKYEVITIQNAQLASFERVRFEVLYAALPRS